MSGMIFKYSFFISSVLYDNWGTHLLYIIIMLVIIFILTISHKKQLAKEKSSWLIHQNQLIEKTKITKETELKKEIEQLKNSNESLKKDIRKKSIELAKKAKENNSNNHILHKVKDNIKEIEKNPSVISKIKLKETRRLLDSYLETEDNVFETQIDEIHQVFFKKMLSLYPDLTNYDLRLSAYLKMGLKTKEIAEILHVLPSSINVSRSRLRKKLDLDPSEDLFSFMNEI